MSVYVSVCGCVPVRADALGIRKRGLEFLELELPVVWKCGLETTMRAGN